MTAAIATTLRKTLVSAAIAAATMVVGTGSANATLYEYSFTGLVQSASSSDGQGNVFFSAYGFTVGSPITGRLWFDTDAQLSRTNGTRESDYDAGSGMSGFTIDGFDSFGTISASTIRVINEDAGTPYDPDSPYDKLHYFADFNVPNAVLSVGGWGISAPTSWLSNSAMPAGLPISDLLLQRSGGSFTSLGSLGSQSLQFSFTSISPVPEPSTYALMLAGLALVGGVAARKRNGAALAA